MIVLRYLFKSFPFLFGLIWAAVGTPFLLIAIVALQSRSEMEKHGVATDAMVIEKLEAGSSGDTSTYTLKYTFTDEQGREHSAAADAPWNSWPLFKPGGKVRIIYLPDRPSESRLVSNEEGSRHVPLILAAFGCVFAPVGWYLVYRGWRTTQRTLAVLRTGETRTGEVTGLELDMRTKINGRHPRYLTYKFSAPDGGTYEGRSPNLPRRMEEDWRVGTPITVVCDVRDPSWHEADIFGLRRNG